MSLLEKIRQDMLSSMKEKDSERVEILKMSLASFKNAEIQKEKDLDDKEQEQILRKEVKKLKDAYEQYIQGGREDLAEKEKKQVDILEEYLPKLMTEEDIIEVVKAKKEVLGIDSKKDMGKLIGSVMKELAGKADGGVVKNVVEEILNED